MPPPVPVPSGRRGLPVAALAALATLLVPTGTAAQAPRAVLGAAVGAAGGAWVTLGIVTASARAGRFLYSPAEASWQLVPIPLGAVTGGVLGHRGGPRFRRAVVGGATGFGVGALLGAGIGAAVARTREGTWAGAVIGSAAGLVWGSVAGGLTGNGGEEAVGPADVLVLTVPVPW